MLKKIILSAVSAGTLFAGTLFAEELKYAGSDFLSGKTEAALKQGLAQIAPKTTLSGELIGSKIALEKLRKNEIDFALLMIQDPDAIPELKEKKWRANTVAYQVSYLVVPLSNPAEEISIFQLRGIFADFAETPLKTWNQVSAAVTGTPKIQCIVSAPEESAAVVAFQSLVFPRAGYNPEVRKTADNEDAIRALLNTTNGIALVSAPPKGQPSLKMLAVSPANKKDQTATAYQPLRENIYNRDYPLAVQFFLVYPQENRSKILPVLKTVLSDAFAKSLEEATLTPIPKNIRELLKKNIDETQK